MFLLALYPCLDTDLVVKNDHVTINETQAANSFPTKDGGEHEEGDCSPFCVCNCCHTHIVISEIPLFSFVVLQSSSIEHSSSLRTLEVIRPILRPPIQA